MATYPAGVYAPTPKSAGQTIQASFFNDPDAEITATQDALKNGIPHAITISTGGLTVSTGSVNIGGPSSLATLNVTGGSTLAALRVTSTASFASSVTAAALGVSGDVAIAGALTVGGNSVTGGIQSFALVTNASTQALNNNAWTGLSWTVQTVLTDAGLHSTASNSSRIALISSGAWMVGGQWSFIPATTPSSAHMAGRILLNDSDAVVEDFRPFGGSRLNFGVSLSAMVHVTSTTSYVTFQAYQNIGASTAVNGSTGISMGPPQFWARRVA